MTFSLREQRPIEERFWEKVEKTLDCWNWTGARSSTGRAQTWHRGRKAVASRVSWELAQGSPPPSHLHVCHHCDNPLCIRPSHLFLGTNQENMQDAARKGRIGAWTHPERLARGERHGQSKLTPDVVLELRRRAAAGESVRALAREITMSESATRNAVNGRNWAWLKDDAALARFTDHEETRT